eukprot:5545562-Prymnesium_polylepis.1
MTRGDEVPLQISSLRESAWVHWDTAARIVFDPALVAYISYEDPACDILPRLEDGSRLPERKPFVDTQLDEEALTFDGTIDWAPTAWHPDQQRWVFHMEFSPDMATIMRGTGALRPWDRTTRSHTTPSTLTSSTTYLLGHTPHCWATALAAPARSDGVQRERRRPRDDQPRAARLLQRAALGRRGTRHRTTTTLRLDGRAGGRSGCHERQRHVPSGRRVLGRVLPKVHVGCEVPQLVPVCLLLPVRRLHLCVWVFVTARSSVLAHRLDSVPKEGARAERERAHTLKKATQKSGSTPAPHLSLSFATFKL